ncbi:MAG: hypothetical protein MUC96_19920 [Myxococcaceae bacterium]|jgi:hypothetical protein|nr:hypothetical protein [Myxococcaceae bacterium]
MRTLLLFAAAWCAVPAWAQEAVPVPGLPARPAVPAPQVPSLTPSEVLPASTATEAFEWQPRPVTTFDVARRARVAPLTVRQALDAFYARANGAGIQDTWPDLSAYFEVHPEAMAVAHAERRARKMPINAIVPFSIALGKTRVPDARALLLAVVRDVSETPMDRTRAMFALVDRDDVGVDFAEELSRMATASAAGHAEVFLKGEAMLALSMMAGLKRKDAALHDVSARAVQALLATGAPNDSRIAMKAIGNMADPALLPLAVPVSRHADPYVRQEAAYAFRRLNPVHSEALVVGWLATEKHPFVKARLYQIAQLQHFDLHTGASEALTRQALKDLPSFSSGVDRRTVIRLVAQSSVRQAAWVRDALVAQARFEHQRNTGYLNEFTDVLTPAEMWKVLR